MTVTVLTERYPALTACADEITRTVDTLCDAFTRGHTLYVCGNGGSAADSEHIVGELMKGFMHPRPLGDEERAALAEVGGEEGTYVGEHLQKALPAVSLVSSVSLATAFANDVAADVIFAQQVHGLARAGDVLLGISTSGNARNVVYAMHAARAKGVTTIGLAGKDGGKLARCTDICIIAPSPSTPDVQELHLPIYHYICQAVEDRMFGGDS